MVEVHAYTIGESLPAPYFKIIEQPNDFSKTVKSITKSGDLSAAQEARLDFWTRFMWVHTAYVTKKDGTRVYAKDYGKRCFCFWVDGRKKRKKSNFSKV